MPCSNRKARLLLQQKKAKIIQYTPFTIQLLGATGENKQEVRLGVDTGARHMGVAVTSHDTVLVKGEISFRQDIKGLLETRKTYRRSRRSRKTRYRKARFLNRKKKEGWLPPSLESRVQNTFRWVDCFLSLLPDPSLHVEVGKFDVQKMMNPSVQGVDYQQGETAGYHDVRYFVFARDQYTCQVCNKRGGILCTHHVIYRSHGGSDRASNLITVCTDCHTHDNHQPGAILWTWMNTQKKTPQYKEPPFMNTLRKRLFAHYPTAQFTYGSLTTPHRKELGLPKSHANDAIAITGIARIKRNPKTGFQCVQCRKKKRSLHEATARKGRKTPNVTQKRNKKNTKAMKSFSLHDKVRCFSKIGFISGFTNTGVYVKTIDDTYVTKPNKTYKQVSFKDITKLHHTNNWQFISHLPLIRA